MQIFISFLVLVLAVGTFRILIAWNSYLQSSKYTLKILSRKRLSSKQISRLSKRTKNNGADAVWREIFFHKNTPIDVLTRASVNVKLGNIPADRLAKFDRSLELLKGSSHKDYHKVAVREYLISELYPNEEVVDYALNSGKISYAIHLTMNRNIRDETQELLANNTSPKVRYALLHNESRRGLQTESKILVRLLTDPDLETRELAYSRVRSREIWKQAYSLLFDKPFKEVDLPDTWLQKMVDLRLSELFSPNLSENI